MRLIILSVLFCCRVAGVQAQESVPQVMDTSAKYVKDPKLPAFNILLTDSATMFNTEDIPKGKPTVLLFFSPDCSHCQEKVQMLLKGMDSLKDVRFYLMSGAHNVTDIRNFADKYHLQDYKNIMVVGKDINFFFISFYGTKRFPDVAVYDKHNKFVARLEQNFTVKDLYEAIH